jgi:hypothetical protein
MNKKLSFFIGQPWFGRISSNTLGREQKKVTWRRISYGKLKEVKVEEISLLKLISVFPEFHKFPLGLTEENNSFSNIRSYNISI